MLKVMIKVMNNRTKNIDKATVKDDSPESEEIIDAPLPESADSTENTEAKESKQSPGAILKNARESQGISLEIVHEATKIPLDALRAIEEGYTVRMLSPFYYSGFVKMYANYLNIDAAQVIADYKQEELPEHIEHEIEDYGMPKWITNFFTRQRKQQIVICAGILLLLFLLIKIIGFLVFREPKPVVKKEVIKIEAVKKEITKVVQEPRKAIRQKPPKIIAPKEAPKVMVPIIPKPIKPVVNKPPAAIKKDVNLTVRANQNSWLRVKTDGIVVFQSTLKIGAVETWFADKEIEISGRNINQLEFELNGKMIGTLGRKDRNAKKVVITKRGLSVKQ